MKLSKMTKKVVAIVCSLALILTSVAFENLNVNADNGSWAIGNVNFVTTMAQGKQVYAIENLTFTAYESSATTDYAYAAYIDTISADTVARSASNDWVWGINVGGNNLNFDKVCTTQSRSITFEPGVTHKIIIAVYPKDTAQDAYSTVPLDTIEKDVTAPSDVITTTPAQAIDPEPATQDTVDVSAITDWTMLGTDGHTLSNAGTNAYISGALRSTINKNAGLEGFYTANDSTMPWGKNSQGQATYGYVCGNGATSVIINGMRYFKDGINFIVDGDCCFINQSLFDIGTADQKTFIVTVEGIVDPGTFAITVAKEGVKVGATPEERGYTQYIGTTPRAEVEIAEGWSINLADSNTDYAKYADGELSAFCVANGGNWNWDASLFTYKASGLKADTQYTFSVDVNAASADFELSFDGEKYFNAGKLLKSLPIDTVVTTDSEGNAVASIGAGILGLNNNISFTNPNFMEYVEVPTTTEAVEPVTTAAVEPTTTEAVEPVTTAAVEPTTTEAVEPVTTAVVEPATTAEEPTSAGKATYTFTISTPNTVTGFVIQGTLPVENPTYVACAWDGALTDKATVTVTDNTDKVVYTTSKGNGEGLQFTELAGLANGTYKVTYSYGEMSSVVLMTVAGSSVVAPTTAATPATTVVEPATTVVEPATTVVEPATTVVEPATTVAEPATTVAEPATTVAEPATTVAEPATTVAEPATTVAEPATTVAEPATTVEAPTEAPTTAKPPVETTTKAPVTTTKAPVVTTTKVTAPAKAKVSKAKAGKKKVSLTLKKASGVKGFKIQYSTNKKFKKVTTKMTTKAKYTIKKLKSKKKYYIRVKAYKVVNGKKVYSKKWSSVKKVTVK